MSKFYVQHNNIENDVSFIYKKGKDPMLFNIFEAIQQIKREQAFDKIYSIVGWTYTVVPVNPNKGQ